MAGVTKFAVAFQLCQKQLAVSFSVQLLPTNKDYIQSFYLCVTFVNVPTNTLTFAVLTGCDMAESW